MAKIIGICRRCGGWITVPTNWPKRKCACRRYCDDCSELLGHQRGTSGSTYFESQAGQRRDRIHAALQLRLRERDAKAGHVSETVRRVPGGRVITRGQVCVSPRSGTIRQAWEPRLYSQFGNI